MGNNNLKFKKNSFPLIKVMNLMKIRVKDQRVNLKNKIRENSCKLLKLRMINYNYNRLRRTRIDIIVSPQILLNQTLNTLKAKTSKIEEKNKLRVHLNKNTYKNMFR